MQLFDGPMLGLDFETTGVEVEQDRIVTASLVYSPSPGVVEWAQEWLVNPGVEIPEEATAVHGVTDARAREEGIPTEDMLRPLCLPIINALEKRVPLVVFNAAYDLSLLSAEQVRHMGYPIPAEIGPVLDPFVIDKELDRYRKGKRTLTAMCELYGVVLEDAHTSVADATAAVELARRLPSRLDFPDDLNLLQLHARQKEWYWRQRTDFQQYLRGQGKEEELDREWPLKTISPPAVSTIDNVGVKE